MSILCFISTIFFLVLFNNGYKAHIEADALILVLIFSVISLFLTRFYYIKFQNQVNKEIDEQRRKNQDYQGN